MKVSNSVRMKLAHIFAQQSVWMIRHRAGRMMLGKNAPVFKTYNDLVAFALRKEKMEELIKNVAFELVSLQTQILKTEFLISRHTRDLFDRDYKYSKQSRLFSIRRSTEEMQLAEAKFNVLYAIQLEICGESTEEDKAKLIASTPRNERWDSFYFTVANALHEGHKITTILEVLEEQYEYTQPCCCCGNEFGCDCGCTCEEYGDHCGCGDDDDDCDW